MSVWLVLSGPPCCGTRLAPGPWMLAMAPKRLGAKFEEELGAACGRREDSMSASWFWPMAALMDCWCCAAATAAAASAPIFSNDILTACCCRASAAAALPGSEALDARGPKRLPTETD
ncbi:hypothetical protein DFJ74DRAFT_643085 [Hyaloraphidium curvatum]|nr:hypothetical protein DFJ74DRAFT_643085 [Hyaloraphidium curvatum]